MMDELEYDPDKGPNPKDWLSMGEWDRIAVADEWHRRARIPLPNRQLHATLHVMVETQLAEGKPPEARKTLARLLQQGLSRHDAIHAIGSVLAEQLARIVSENGTGANPTADYQERLRALTAESWRSSGSG